MTRPLRTIAAVTLALALAVLSGSSSRARANDLPPVEAEVVEVVNEAPTAADVTTEAVRVEGDTSRALHCTVTVSTAQRAAHATPCEESTQDTPAKIAAAVRGAANLTRALYRNAILLGVALVRTAVHTVSAIA